jgi:hypothetical protein
MAVFRRLFGEPPFQFLAMHLAQDDDFLKDARQILSLDDDAYRRLATQLSKADTFLSRSELAAVVAEAVGEGSDRLAKVIYGIAQIVHDADMPASEAMDVLATGIEDKSTSLGLEERRTLIERLRKLVAEPIGFAKQFKARQLVDAIGAELDAFRIICDMRPVFDQGRERIVGAVPITMLRLEYTRTDGDSAVVEVRVTEKQLTQFGERVEEARRKLRIIKDLLTQSKITIPKTKSTVPEDES